MNGFKSLDMAAMQGFRLVPTKIKMIMHPSFYQAIKGRLRREIWITRFAKEFREQLIRRDRYGLRLRLRRLATEN